MPAEKDPAESDDGALSAAVDSTVGPDANAPKEVTSPISGNASDDDDDDDRLQTHHSRTESIWIADHFSTWQEILFVGIGCTAQFCTQAGFAGTIVLLHTIGDSFGISSPGELSWLVAGYSLTVGTFILFSGRLGDVFGYKKMLIIGFVWFSLWSVIAGVSIYSNYVLFVFSRVFQGIGPALCLPNALAIFGAAYPPSHRKAMVFSFFGASAPVGGVAGGIVAAALSLEWWPWAFWSLAITLAIVAIVTYFAIPEPARKLATPHTLREVWVELDIPGALCGVTALVLFNFAWNQAPLVGWDKPEVIVTLVLGTALIVVFFVIETRFAEMPLLPFDAVNADVAFVLAVVVCGWATFGIWMLYWIQMSEAIRHNSPVLTIAWLTPVVVTGFLASVFTGILLGPLKVTPPTVMTMALVAFLVGVTLTATVPPTQIYWGQTFVSTLVMPFGMDMSFPAATLILSNAVAKRHQGIGASLVNTVVNYGISLGVGFAGTVEIHVNNGGLNEEDLLKGFRGGLYMGIGLSALGVAICIIFVVRDRWRRRQDKVRRREESTDQRDSSPSALDGQ